MIICHAKIIKHRATPFNGVIQHYRLLNIDRDQVTIKEIHAHYSAIKNCKDKGSIVKSYNGVAEVATKQVG